MQELIIYQYLAKLTSSHLGAKYIIALLDSFRHHGPSSIPLGLLFKPIGTNTNHMVEYLSYKSPKGNGLGYSYRYPESMAKEILRYTLLGLHFLHLNRIIYGDV
jgi:serine/threonine protein kinase